MGYETPPNLDESITSPDKYFPSEIQNDSRWKSFGDGRTPMLTAPFQRIVDENSQYLLHRFGDETATLFLKIDPTSVMRIECSKPLKPDNLPTWLKTELDRSVHYNHAVYEYTGSYLKTGKNPSVETAFLGHQYVVFIDDPKNPIMEHVTSAVLDNPRSCLNPFHPQPVVLLSTPHENILSEPNTMHPRDMVSLTHLQNILTTRTTEAFPFFLQARGIRDGKQIAADIQNSVSLTQKGQTEDIVNPVLREVFNNFGIHATGDKKDAERIQLEIIQKVKDNLGRSLY